ncbi:hypothetical protein ACFQ1S_45105, partial [Kibdelosporangium lantanae]
EGALRPDVGLLEIAQFMNMLVLRLEPGDTTTKLLQVMVDGLRTHPGPTPGPGTAVREQR